MKVALFSILTSLMLHGLIFLSPFSNEQAVKTNFSSKKSSFKVSFNEVRKTRKRKKVKKTRKQSRTLKENQTPKKKSDKTVDTGMTKSTVLRKVIPKYPYKSRKYHEEGTVLLKVFVNDAGIAYDAIIIKGSGFERLDKAAREASLESEYKSSRKNGTKVAGSVELEFKFELNN